MRGQLDARPSGKRMRYCLQIKVRNIHRNYYWTITHRERASAVCLLLCSPLDSEGRGQRWEELGVYCYPHRLKSVKAKKHSDQRAQEQCEWVRLSWSPSVGGLQCGISDLLWKKKEEKNQVGRGQAQGTASRSWQPQSDSSECHITWLLNGICVV